jgi:Trypsin-like peptidase domain
LGIERLPASSKVQGGETTHNWTDTASQIWSEVSSVAREHPVIATSAAVIGSAAAVAAFKGRAGALMDAFMSSEKAAKGGESLLAASESVLGGSKSILAASESVLGGSKSILAASESVLPGSESALAASSARVGEAANIGGKLSPVWISGPEKIISPSGIQIITTDLGGLNLGAAVDAFPQIPKLVVSDPLFRAGGLITDFKGNLPGLYETAANSVVRLQVTRTMDAATYAKLGSGYFNPEGYIVTAHHVVSGGEEITVFGKSFDAPLRAMVHSADPEHDLAVLKLVDPPSSILRNIRPFGYRPASELLKPSEQVVGFGFPNGVETLTAMPGNFSNWKNIQLGVATDMTGNAMRSFMETGPGASGGAMVDAQGRLLGTIVQMNKGDHASWSVPYTVIHAL